MWVSRAYRDGKPIHLFRYHHSREKEFAKTLLAGYSGFLQTDGYAGYTEAGSSPGITHVTCFAHIRRRFVEAYEIAGKQGKANEAIQIIRRIYNVESELRKKLKDKALTESDFLAERKRRVTPILEEFRAWLGATSPDVVPQGALGKAIQYALAQLDAAAHFVDHSLLMPDTNAVENALRPFVIGRKNWLFTGNPLGAHASAGLYSIIETAKANGHEPYLYLCYLFDMLPRCSTSAEREAFLPYRLDPSSYAGYAGN
jgi:transposase